MAKVTYLFGAGASCECLPVVKHVPDRLEALRLLVSGYNPDDMHNMFRLPGQTKATLKNDIDVALLDLIGKVKLHASIDTYAKKLMLTQNYDYVKLKVLLTFSFIYDQMLKPPDRRYDSFFASIMTDTVLSFLDVRILSWNYDYQFEKSFTGFRNDNSLTSMQYELNVIPFDSEVRQSDKFSIFKLNGTTAFRNSNGFYNCFDDLSKNDTSALFEELFKFFSEIKANIRSIRSMLGFAWEQSPLSQKVLQEGIRGIEKTKAIVIIGYSFPFFNRDIDKQIFQNLNTDVKFYIQDTNPEMVANNLLSVLPQNVQFRNKPILIEVKPQLEKPIEERDINQFYLPAEL